MEFHRPVLRHIHLYRFDVKTLEPTALMRRQEVVMEETGVYHTIPLGLVHPAPKCDQVAWVCAACSLCTGARQAESPLQRR